MRWERYKNYSEKARVLIKETGIEDIIFVKRVRHRNIFKEGKEEKTLWKLTKREKTRRRMEEE